MNYQKLEQKFQKFIELEPTMTEEVADEQSQKLAKEAGLSVVVFWDLLDLMETSYYNLSLFEKCIKSKEIHYR